MLNNFCAIIFNILEFGTHVSVATLDESNTMPNLSKLKNKFGDTCFLTTGTPDINEGKMVSVHAEQANSQHRKAVNGSIPGSNNHTPMGSEGKS